MCGFLGVYSLPSMPISKEEISSFRLASERVAHRGNTGRGELASDSLALFHYRLAFRDVSEGKQPLTDKQNRATIIFNGELYDFHPLRGELAKSYDFKTRSDTEVILAAYLVYGIDFLDKLNGEYAFIIYDHRNQQILAGRDPFGVKPLFWSFYPEVYQDSFLRTYQNIYAFAVNSSRLFFTSEIKGLPFPLSWDSTGLGRQMTSLYEEMGTAFQGVYALAPGAILLANPAGPEKWNIKIERKIRKRRRPQSNIDFDQNAANLKKLVQKSVIDKLDSEVPLGAYLSGGIDSRIAAHIMGQHKANIETFTVGFEGKDYDETDSVREFLAQYPNLKGRVLKTTNSALEYSYPHAIYASELVQPYTNGSAKWWLSRFARKYVRGVLTGDGSDEMFCGYPSFRYLAWWSFYQKSPSKYRESLYARRVVGGNDKAWEKGLSSQQNGMDLKDSIATLGWAHPLFSQISYLAPLWFGHSSDEWLETQAKAIYSYIDSNDSPLTAWQNYFLHTHFPTHVLNWVGDRMEMANTLEGRPIYLSREILDLVIKTPDIHMVRGMKDKAILRKAFASELGGFISSPKKQFNAPFLFDGILGKEFLNPSALKETNLIDPEKVARARIARLEPVDALEKSFAEIFLQNCLVVQMLDRYVVKGNPPTRDIAFEENYLERNETI